MLKIYLIIENLLMRLYKKWLLIKKVLAVILARGGSKGIKLKNITNLSGHPLISYTLEANLKIQNI